MLCNASFPKMTLKKKKKKKKILSSVFHFSNKIRHCQNGEPDLLSLKIVMLQLCRLKLNQDWLALWKSKNSCGIFSRSCKRCSWECSMAGFLKKDDCEYLLEHHLCQRNNIWGNIWLHHTIQICHILYIHI